MAAVVAGYLAVRTSSAPGTRSVTTSAQTKATTTPTVNTTILPDGALALSSEVSPEGLQLRITLNSSSVSSHGALAARIDLVNTLDENVSAAVPALNQSSNYCKWNQQDQICGENPSGLLVDFAVFKGHISAGDISKAGQQLRLAPPFYPPCAAGASFNSVTLLPHGDLTNYSNVNYSQPPPRSSYVVKAEVNATTYYCTGSGLGGHGGEIDCGNTSGLVGYWNATAVASGGDCCDFASPAFTYFPPGQYTIVATNPWGQYVYATFIVETTI